MFPTPGTRLIITKANFLSQTESEQNTDRFKQATPHFRGSRSFTLPHLHSLSSVSEFSAEQIKTTFSPKAML